MRLGGHPAVGRLTKRPEFLAAASGRRFHTERMTLQARRRGEHEPGEGLRVGFTITKKVGHATERNRIRRRLRSAIVRVGPAFIGEPLDVVVIGRRPALDAAFEILLQDLSQGFGVITRSRTPRKPETAATVRPERAPQT